jgi:predicted PurR-regulated permease PerM
VLSPHLMKKGMKLHPLLVVFGVFAGGEIGGVGGIFLSVPVLALVRLVYYEWRKRRTILKTLVKTEAVTSGTS